MSLDSIDIQLDSSFQPVPSATGEFKTTGEYEGVIQEIKLEALTQEGELFYDEKYGWSLYDFIQANDDELTKIEIAQRCKTKLSKYDYINQESVYINVTVADGSTEISITFKILNSDTVYNITLLLDRVNIEVTAL